MIRARLARLSIRLATSLTSTRQLGLHSLALTQVTRPSQLTQSPLFSPPTNHNTRCNPFNLHQKAFFSSKPQSFVDLILSKDWSEEIEVELEKLDLNLTHESIVYTLMKLNGDPQKSLDFFKWVIVKKEFEPSYVPYTVLLRSLVCQELVNAFWNVALEMHIKGFYIDVDVNFNVISDLKRQKMFKTVNDWNLFYKKVCDVYNGNEYVNEVVKLMLECGWSEEVEGKLKKKLRFPLSENVILRVLFQMRKQPLKALKFFEWVCSCEGFEHNSASYNAMLRVLSAPETKLISEFWKLVERMRCEGFEVDFDSLLKMFRHLPIGDSVKLFEFMMDGPYKPSLAECNLLLKSISEKPNPDKELAHRLVNKCMDAGYTLSKKEYDGMHTILCKIDGVDEAKKIVQDLRDAGYKLDNTNYSQEMYDLCSEKRFVEACNLLDQMESNGCIPDVNTWTMLLKGYYDAGQMDEALSCFLRMSEKNADPDADTLEVLLNDFLSNNKLLDAYRVLVEVVNKGQIKPWMLTFLLMIEKLAEVRKLEEAFDLLSMMKKQGYPPCPEPIVQYISKLRLDLILSKDWSEETEFDFEKLDLKLTHESIVYILTKLNGNPQKSLDFFKWVSVKNGFDRSYVPYSLLLRSLACRDFVKDFWNVALEMRNKGFYIDVHDYCSILKDLNQKKMINMVADWIKFYKDLCKVYDKDGSITYVIHLMLEYNWNEEMKGKLKQQLRFPLSESSILRVLSEVRKQPWKALQFFEWVGSCGGYKHNTVSYNAMLKVIATPETELIQEFWELVERMRSEGFEVDYDSFLKMHRHLPVGDAVRLFEIMMDGPFKPPLAECSLLLTSISRRPYPDMELAFRVVNKCVAAGYTLSKKEYDGMHKILCKIGRFDEAKKIVQEMRDAGYEPDNTTYGQEIYGLCSQKRFEEAFNLLKQMESNGCVPNLQTWTVLLKGYCIAGQLDQALSCLCWMSEKNVYLDAGTLEALLNGFLSKNKVFGAYKFLVEMVNKGQIKPWQSTFKLMIEKLAKFGNIEEALGLLSMMKEQGYPPFPEPIIRYISQSGTDEDAKKVLGDTRSYIQLIKCYFEEGRESEAKDLIRSSLNHVSSLSSSKQTAAVGQY